MTEQPAELRRGAVTADGREIRQLADFLPDGVLLARGYTIEYVNQAACRILEAMNAEEVLGRNLPDFVHEGRSDLVRDRLKRASMGLSNPPFTLEVVSVQGNRIPVESRSMGLERTDGTATLVIWRDLRDRRKLEEQLFQSQKMDAIGRLAIGVAHEFGNLITVIQGNVDRMADRFARREAAAEELSQARAALRRATALTEQLRAFGDQQSPATRSVNCNALVFQMENILRRIIGEDIRLMTLYGKDLGSVKADPAQIEQIVMNLAVNARDAMPQGGVLSLETFNRTVTESWEEGSGIEPGEYAVLQIADTGAGMTAEAREHLFEPFFTTKDRRTGLGLSTVYGMVAQNRGKILCRSEPGRGTTFQVYLPRAREGGPAAGAEPKTQIAAKAGAVLVVDDEESVVGIVSAILRDEGFEVLGVRGAAEALAALQESPGSIGLLIADVVMPGLNGIELSRKAAEVSPRLRVLLLSGYADQTIERYGNLREGDLLLRKPFTAADLTAAVRFAMRDRAR